MTPYIFDHAASATITNELNCNIFDTYTFTHKTHFRYDLIQYALPTTVYSFTVKVASVIK